MAVNRERKMIKVYSGSNVDLKYGTLKDALKTIKSLISEYGADAEIDTHSERYDDREYLGVYITRPETDKEMAARIADEEKWEAVRTERERADYERLKAKFGG